MMTLEQLRIFVKVAEIGHLTRAAVNLNLSQSAVSAAISQLEFRYNLKLFDRIGRNIRLNGNGRDLLPLAQKLLAQAKIGDELLHDLAGGNIGTINLVCSQTIGNYWIAEKIAKFLKLYPQVKLNCTISNTEKAITLVESGAFDIGIIEGQNHSNLIAQEIEGDELTLIAPQSLEYPDINYDFLSRQKFVTREIGSGTRGNLEDYLKGFGITLNDTNLALTLPSNEAVLSAVEAGIGISLLSYLVTKRSINNGRVISRRVNLPHRIFSIISLKERETSKLFQNFRASIS